jgi:peptidoglycan-associated lipoprotein
MQKKFLIYLFFTVIISSCSIELISKRASQNDANNPINKDANNPNEFSRQAIYFDTNSSKIISNEAKQILKNFIAKVKNAKITIIVEGHCDERGSSLYNKKLGKKRAEEVKKFLVKSGIKSSKISTISYGKNKPVDLGHDESAWSKNRRVEIVLFN